MTDLEHYLDTLNSLGMGGERHDLSTAQRERHCELLGQPEGAPLELYLLHGANAYYFTRAGRYVGTGYEALGGEGFTEHFEPRQDALEPVIQDEVPF